MMVYKIGVIGHTGRGNYGHGLDVVWKSIPNCEIVAVADADDKGLETAKKRLNLKTGYSDYRKMLDEAKPDVISVCPRHLDQSRDMIVAAAERGIHMYVEKPLCQTLEQADQIIAACEKKRVKLAIAFQTRYSPKLNMVRTIIDDGEIGQVLEVRGRGKDDRRGGGEDLWVLGSHIMNLMHYFAGEPNWCMAHVQQEAKNLERSHVYDGNEGIGKLAGDNLSALFGFERGVYGFFGSQRGMGPGGEGRFGLRILGSKGQIDLTTGHMPAAHILQDPLWSPGRSNAKWVPISSDGIGKPEPIKDGGLAAGNVLACTDLIAAIEQDRLPEANMYDARMTVEMIASVFASAVGDKRVTIPLKDRRHPLLSL